MAERRFPQPNWQSIKSVKLDLSLKNLYDRLFLILFVVDIALRMIWLNQPTGSLIFDEWYYVNVARVILGLPQSVGSNGAPPYVNPVIGIDPNHEHPPLAKLLIALSMYVFGDNGNIFCALNIVLPLPQLPMGRVPILAQRIKFFANKLSRQIGYVGEIA